MTGIRDNCNQFLRDGSFTGYGPFFEVGLLYAASFNCNLPLPTRMVLAATAFYHLVNSRSCMNEPGSPEEAMKNFILGILSISLVSGFYNYLGTAKLNRPENQNNHPNPTVAEPRQVNRDNINRL